MANWVGVAMPEPNRPPWLIAEDLRAWSIWQLVEMGVTLVIRCDACGHEARWSPRQIDRRLSHIRGKTLAYVASRLRCSEVGCRSEWLRISAAPGAIIGKRPSYWGA